MLLMVLEGWELKNLDKEIKKDSGNFNVICELANDSLKVHRIKKASSKIEGRIQEVCHHFALFCVAAKRPMNGIQTLRMAAEAMGANETVTAAHTACAVLCLKAKCFQHCEDLFSKPVTAGNKYMKPIDVANYNMYRGLIFCGLHKFEKAFDCFRMIMQ
jgi:hypothetical protein